MEQNSNILYVNSPLFKPMLAGWTCRGKHTCEYMDFSPTWNKVVSTGMDRLHLVNGKIVELWDESDDNGELQLLEGISLPA